MTTLTIEIPDQVEKTLADLVEQLGGKVIGVIPAKKQNKAAKKQQILSDLQKSAEWIRLHQQGKVEAKTIKQLLNELY